MTIINKFYNLLKGENISEYDIALLDLIKFNIEYNKKNNLILTFDNFIKIFVHIYKELDTTNITLSYFNIYDIINL